MSVEAVTGIGLPAPWTNSVGTGPYAVTNTVVSGTPTTPGFPQAQPLDASAKVAWSAATANGSPITAHVITPYIGTVAQPAQTFNNANTSDVVTGLVNRAGLPGPP